MSFIFSLRLQFIRTFQVIPIPDSFVVFIVFYIFFRIVFYIVSYAIAFSASCIMLYIILRIIFCIILSINVTPGCSLMLLTSLLFYLAFLKMLYQGGDLIFLLLLLLFGYHSDKAKHVYNDKVDKIIAIQYRVPDSIIAGVCMLFLKFYRGRLNVTLPSCDVITKWK